MSRSTAPEIIELLSDSDEEVAPDAAGAALSKAPTRTVTPAPTAEGARDLDDEDEPMTSNRVATLSLIHI